MEDGQFYLNRPILRLWLELPAIRASYLNFVNNPHWSDAYSRVQELLGRPAEGHDVALGFGPMVGQISTPIDIGPNVTQQDNINTVFVDDISPVGQANAHLLIETSQNSWHAHFNLSESVSYEEAHSIQRYLCELYKGDKNATRPGQPRRFPNPLLRVIQHTELAPLDAPYILSQVMPNAPCPVVKNVTMKQLPDIADLWNKYLKSHGRNASSADLCLALRLHTLGCTDDEIIDALQQMLKEHPRIKGPQYHDSVVSAAKKYRARLNA